MPYTPQQNGKAERLNRTLLTKTRALLADTTGVLDKTYWADAVVHSNLLRNLSPASGKAAVPYTLLHGTEPDVSHLRQFGCKVYVLDPKQRRVGKLDPVSTPGVFIGFQPGTKGYKVLLSDTGKTSSAGM